MTFRFHVLGVPHTISIPDYSSCAFTQKVLKLCKILRSRGHTVIHYGHEHSQVACSEHVTVTRDEDLQKSYGDHDWRTSGYPDYKGDDHVYKAFNARTIAALFDRKKPGDFLLCMFGSNHKVVADANADMIVCEPGIGYYDGGFAKFRIFESYSTLHAYLGRDSIGFMNNEMWYDAVIPLSYDVAEFPFKADKSDYLLFVGRVNAGKGIHIAIQIAEAVDRRLIIAGPGEIGDNRPRTNRPLSEYVEQVGVVGPEERNRLLADAYAVVAPSCFLEPFCSVNIESMLCGTPVITTDWGAFAEYNLHGITGFRCRTFEHFTWAARNIERIDPQACRAWAERNFSLEKAADMYEEYFSSVHKIFSGDGWYSENPERRNLDWLERHYPMPNSPAR